MRFLIILFLLSYNIYMASAPPQNSGPTQMATRIDTLPLRTDSNNNVQDIDDPIIQNVLQEFENEMANSKKIEQPYMMQNQQYVQQQQYPVYQQHMMQNTYQPTNHQFKQHKKLLDSNILQKTFIITIIVFFLLNYNVMHLIISKMPDVATSYISGREFIFNFVIIFGIFYSLTYFDVL